MLKTIRTPSQGSDERQLGIQAAPLPWLLKYVDNNKINYTYQCLLANFPLNPPPKKAKNTVSLQKAAVRNLNRLICGCPERENKHFEGISCALLWRLFLRLQSAAFQSGAIRGLPLAGTWRCASPRWSRNKTTRTSVLKVNSRTTACRQRNSRIAPTASAARYP